MLREELKGMRAKDGYLAECDYEELSKDVIVAQLTAVQQEVKKVEADIDELSKKEDYEAAERKQAELTALQGKLAQLVQYTQTLAPEPQDGHNPPPVTSTQP
jgi:uncharacterized protein YciW